MAATVPCILSQLSRFFSLLIYCIPFVLAICGLVVAGQEQATPQPYLPDGDQQQQQQPGARYSTVERDFGSIESLHDTSSEEFARNSVIQHEFRIAVGPRSAQCFFQRLPANAHLHVSFQVIGGLDRNIEFLITGPGNQILEHIEWTADASIQKPIPFEGLYQICLRNYKSQFSEKLIYFYLSAYTEDMHQHSQNILELFEGTQSIQDSIDTVDKRMKQVQLEQALSRRHVISDWYLLRDNNSYVQILSIILCCVIVATSAFQVFFVRRLFGSTNSASKKNQRA